MSDARVVEVLETSMGNLGSAKISTVAVTATAPKIFTALQFITDSVVALSTSAVGYTNADLTSYTVITAGTWLYGGWSAITLTSGEGIAYYGEK